MQPISQANISPLYRRAPKGNHADPRIMSFSRCWQMACNSPDAAMRRVAVLHYPTILDTWAESGMCKLTIAATLGFSHWNQLRFWLWDTNLLTDFLYAYRDAADTFAEAADLKELHAAGVSHPAFAFAAYQYRDYTPKELRRMAGRNNPDKYTPAGKLRATPVSSATTTVSTTSFTGWTPGMVA